MPDPTDDVLVALRTTRAHAELLTHAAAEHPGRPLLTPVLEDEVVFTLVPGVEEAVANLAVDLAMAETVVRSVRELHAPIEALNVRSGQIEKVCSDCGTDDGNWRRWPCATVRALGTVGQEASRG